jgi:hypothetical protein
LKLAQAKQEFAEEQLKEHKSIQELKDTLNKTKVEDGAKLIEVQKQLAALK